MNITGRNYMKFGNFIFLLLISIITIDLAQRNYSIQIETYRHVTKPGVYKYMNLKLVNYSNHMVYNGCYIFSQDVESFEARFEIIVPKKNARPWIPVNVTLDGCKMLEGASSRSAKLINRIVGPMLANSPQAPKKCPLKKNTLYCYLNFSLESVKLPTYLPEMKLKFVYTILEKKIIYYKGYFDVKIATKK